MLYFHIFVKSFPTIHCEQLVVACRSGQPPGQARADTSRHAQLRAGPSITSNFKQVRATTSNYEQVPPAASRSEQARRPGQARAITSNPFEFSRSSAIECDRLGPGRTRSQFRGLCTTSSRSHPVTHLSRLRANVVEHGLLRRDGALHVLAVLLHRGLFGLQPRKIVRQSALSSIESCTRARAAAQDRARERVKQHKIVQQSA